MKKSDKKADITEETCPNQTMIFLGTYLTLFVKSSSSLKLLQTSAKSNITKYEKLQKLKHNLQVSCLFF